MWTVCVCGFVIWGHLCCRHRTRTPARLIFLDNYQCVLLRRCDKIFHFIETSIAVQLMYTAGRLFIWTIALQQKPLAPSFSITMTCVCKAQLISERSVCVTKGWAVLQHRETQVSNLTLGDTEVATILCFIKTAAVHLHEMHLININIKAPWSQICIKGKQKLAGLRNSTQDHICLHGVMNLFLIRKSPFLALSLTFRAYYFKKNLIFLYRYMYIYIYYR